MQLLTGSSVQVAPLFLSLSLSSPLGSIINRKIMKGLIPKTEFAAAASYSSRGNTSPHRVSRCNNDNLKEFTKVVSNF
jgi:hypothetical protein